MLFISFTGPNLPPYSYDKLTLAHKKTGSSEMATFMLSRASRGCMSKAHQHRDYVLSQTAEIKHYSATSTFMNCFLGLRY